MADCSDYIGKLTQEATAGTADGDNDVAQKMAKLSFGYAMETMIDMSQRKECFANGYELSFETGQVAGTGAAEPLWKTELDRVDKQKVRWYSSGATPIVEQALYPRHSVYDASHVFIGWEMKREVKGPDSNVIPDSVQK